VQVVPLPPLEPGGLLPAVRRHPSVKLSGPVFAGTVATADVQVPFGCPGQGTVIVFAPAVSVSAAVAQLSEVPPVLVKAILALNATVQLDSEVMKFEKTPPPLLGQAEMPVGSRTTSLACGATGALRGKPGVPLFDHTRVYVTPIFGVEPLLS
jgi:hypothetical protein